MSLKRALAALLLALPLVSSCRSDDSLNPPSINDPMFRRYVSIGNSITAGLQSGGINDSTQQRSYAHLLAMAMGTDFNMPLFNQLGGNGCPPPIDVNSVNPPHRVGGGTSATCSLRAPTTGFINNVAFPGAEVSELFNPLTGAASATDVYKQFILGGRSEIEMMKALKPTFVSVWIGANDATSALLDANPGNPASVKDPTAFAAAYDSLLDALDATGAKAVLVGVPMPNLAPYASSAAVWFCLKNGDGAGGDCPAPFPPRNPTLQGIPTFSVNVNCAPVPPAGGGIPVLVPWTVGLAKVGAAAVGVPSSIDCSVDNEVVSATEIGNMIAAATAYNAHISSEATARGYAYWDPNPLFAAGRDNVHILPFPNLTPALAGGNVTFGTWFSLDGFHPSSLGHQVMADSIAATINTFYGTSLPVPVCGGVTCPTP